MDNWLEKLIGPTGRGKYQADDIATAMSRGQDRYARDHSLAGFIWPLFADVGTGKTPSTLVYVNEVREFLKRRRDPRAEKPVLFIVPATVKWNWYAEAKTWTDLGPADVLVIDGDPSTRKVQLQYMQLVKPKMVILNYELVTIHQQFFQHLGSKEDPFFLAIICDEAHYIKWVTSQRARAVRSICAEFHGGLTGTPMTNKPDSLWGVVDWLANGETYMRTVPARPPTPNNNCPLDKWARKRILNSRGGCEICRHWNPHAETCKKYADKSVGRKPFRDAKEEVRIRYRRTGTWGSFDRFKQVYCDMELQTWYERGGVERSAYRVVGPKRSAMDELNRRLKKFGMIRWRRAEVLKLEPIIYEHVALQATPEQRDIYNQLHAGYLNLYGDSGEHLGTKAVRNILAQLTYFRRATTLTPRELQLGLQGRNPVFAPDLRIRVDDKGAKQDWLLEFVSSQLDQDGSGDKFLIFGDWTSCLRPLLKRVARAAKLDILKWDKRGGVMIPSGEVKDPVGYCGIIEGDTPKVARQAISERWNSDPLFKVFLGSPAAFEGINMQGGISPDSTAYVIIMNMPWLPKDVIQAIGRAWRFGQDGQVVVLFPAVTGTIDEKMTKTLLSKQSSQDLSVDGGEQQMAKLFDPKSHREVLDLI